MITNLKINQAVGQSGSIYLAKFLNPERIVSGFDFLPGMKAAHFGCGTGYFTFLIAKRIGADGKIFALDILSEKIEVVERQARILRLNNILAKKVNLENKNGSHMKDEELDWVIIVNMLYQNENKNRIIWEASRILKTGGKILFIDWKENAPVFGPEKRKRVSREEMIKLSGRNSLGILKEIEASEYHFGMLLQKIAKNKKEIS